MKITLNIMRNTKHLIQQDSSMNNDLVSNYPPYILWCLFYVKYVD